MVVMEKLSPALEPQPSAPSFLQRLDGFFQGIEASVIVPFNKAAEDLVEPHLEAVLDRILPITDPTQSQK
jgi:hypothetical protein